MVFRVFLLLALLSVWLALPCPIQAAEEPAVTDSDTVAASVPNARFARALRRAALWQRLSGKIDRATYRSVVQFTRNPERVTPEGKVNLVEQVKNATVEQMCEEAKTAGAAPRFDFMIFLQFIIDNWPAIMEMIQTIIDLFSYAPADAGCLVYDAPAYVLPCYESPGVTPAVHCLAA